MFGKNKDRANLAERLEIAQLVSASLGSLSLGAAAVVAFTEVINDQPDRSVVAGALAAVTLTGLALTNIAGNKMIEMQAKPDSVVQPGTQPLRDQSS